MITLTWSNPEKSLPHFRCPDHHPPQTQSWISFRVVWRTPGRFPGWRRSGWWPCSRWWLSVLACRTPWHPVQPSQISSWTRSGGWWDTWAFSSEGLQENESTWAGAWWMEGPDTPGEDIPTQSRLSDSTTGRSAVDYASTTPHNAA